MSTPVKLVGFLVVIVAIFGVTFGVGRATGPVGGEPGHTQHTADSGAAADMATSAGEIPGGLMVSQSGYALALAESSLEPGPDRAINFTITGPDGDPVKSYDRENEKYLHLIAVRRDFTNFQHVHPTFDKSTGVWSVGLDLDPGTWRIFADFKPAGGDALVLGADLAIAGDFKPVAPMLESRTATVGDYQVTLDGDLIAGSDAKLVLKVTKDGKPVTDLQPYLGAYGHLVALREGDLAYLHVHPDGTPGDGSTQPGPDVTFYADVPSPGSYHLYLNFQHNGVVRTAAFALTAVGSDTKRPDARKPAEHSGH